MSEFITRIELNENKDASLYAKLHAAMELKGFQRWVTIAGKKKALPGGEYYRVSDLTVDKVSEEALAAARSVYKDVDMITTQAATNGIRCTLKTDYVEPKPSPATILSGVTVNTPRRTF